MRVVNHHSFNTAVAEDFGVEKAIILDPIVYWQRECQESKNGQYWFRPIEAFAQCFTFFTPRKIAELLRQMEKDGLIKTEQRKGMDRTKGYRVTQLGLSYYPVGKCVIED